MRLHFLHGYHHLLTGALMILGLLSGCGGGNSVRYYLVNPVDYTGINNEAGNRLTIEIINLHVPQYLERSHIAVRSGENSLRYSEFNQWGESMRKNLMRTLARNLTALLSTADISTPLSRSSSAADYRLEVHIDQFEQDSNGRVILAARWQLISAAESMPLGIHSADLDSPGVISDGDYDAMVGAMRDLFGRLSEQIADSILALAQEHQEQ